MNDTTKYSSATTAPAFEPGEINFSIVIIVSAAAVACVILGVVVVTVCLIRRRRQRKQRMIPAHLPSPQEIDLHHANSRNDLNRRNPGTPDATRELPPLPSNESERGPQRAVATSQSTESSRARKTSELSSPNYQNVPKFRYSAGDEHKNEESEDANDDEDELHDYENNPIERQKYVTEIQKRTCENRNPHANTLQVGAGPLRPFNTDNKANSFHPTSHSPKSCSTSNSKLSSSSGGPKDRTCPAISASHSPNTMGYINTSFENLDKRTVPQPPTLPPDPVIKAPSFERHCAPPKSHVEKSRGYVNQPV